MCYNGCMVIFWVNCLALTLWLVYDCVKLSCDLMLNYNLMVCGTPNLIELCYSSAYKEHFSI